jgi:predicted MFS family arabinose efflux permease
MHDRRWLALILLCAIQFMVVLDVSIVNVALPTIKTALHFSDANLQWVVSAYTLTFGGFLMLGGRAADLLGRRRMFMSGLVLFSLASLACGLSGDTAQLIAFRAIQGLGAAIISPAALSLLTTTFAEGAERNKALGIWGAIAGMGGAVGVLLGGILVDSVSWEWIFFINVPVGALVFLAAPRLLEESRVETQSRSFDVLGALTVTGGLTLLVYGLVSTDTHSWTSGLVLASLAGASQAFVTRVGVRRTLVVGMTLLIAGLLWFSRVSVGGSYAVDLAPGFVLAGIGLGFSFVPVQIASLVGVTNDEAGIASGLINTSQQVGGALGVAILSTITFTEVSSYISSHASAQPSPLLGAEALVSGFHEAFLAGAAMTLIGLIATLTLIPGGTPQEMGVGEDVVPEGAEG